MFSCFRAVAQNPFFAEVSALLPPGVGTPADPHAPGPFAFADRDRLTGILEEARWGAVSPEPVDFAMIAGAGEDPVEEAMAYFSAIGPTAHALRLLGEDDRQAFLARLRALAEANLRGGQVSLQAAAWIVTARAP